MNPVIQRELLEQARTPALFRLRLISAVGVIGALIWGMSAWAELQRSGGAFFGPWGSVQSEGGFLFSRVQMVLTLIILALAPTLTADAIARERRESTLNLLGLTPLTSIAVAVGKSAANGLRALTLWLSAVPILAVPLLMGGVSGRQMAEVVVAQWTTLMLGLAAGLLASSVTTQFRRALALAFVLELVLFVTVIILQGGLVLLIGMVTGALGISPTKLFGLSDSIGLLLRVVTGEVLVTLPRGPGTNRADWVTWLLGLSCLVVSISLVGVVAVRLAARRVAQLWQEEPPRPGALELQRQLTRPILFPGWIRKRQRARLSRNPLVWIQHRTVAAALTRWGWILVVIVIWMMIATTGGWMGGFGGRMSMPIWMGPMLLMGGMAFSAAGGFRAERENGTLELLLVTPLTSNQLLQSRWLAHLREFLLPVALQLSLSIYVEGLWRRAGMDYSRFNWWLVLSLVCLPTIGLWRGLRARNFVTAVISTGFWGLFVPAAAALLFSALSKPGYFDAPALLESGGFRFFLETRLDWGVLPAAFQLLVGGFALIAVRRELASRQFVLSPTSRE